MRIWFNHWFSTAYNVINLMKRGEKNIHIIGSHRLENSVVRCVCDEWYVEPVLDGEDYVSYCLDFCKEHNVEVFVPHKHLLDICKHKSDFESLGVLVLLDDYEIVSLLYDKQKTYELFLKLGVGNIPEYYVAHNHKEFADYYSILSTKYRRVCCKNAIDIGGTTFEILNDNKVFLMTKTLQCSDEIEPIMLMPFLSGHEFSVDCLKTPSGNIMIPREKSGSRIEKISFNQEVLDVCDKFLSLVDLNTPCNIQFLCEDGVPYVLEVNPRMSGGIQQGCLGTGVNLPNIALNKLLGIDKEWKMDKIEKFVAFVETPIVIRDC